MEEWTKRIVVLDTWHVWHNHLRTLLLSSLLFGFYGAYLWIVCSSAPGVFTGLLLFVSQVCVGFPATRAHFELGMITRSQLRLLHSESTNGADDYKEVDIGIGDVPLFFEGQSMGVKNATRTIVDDYNDLAWFAIACWAVVSTGVYYLGSFPPYLCILGDVVLAGSCIVSYLSGYWMSSGTSLEEELNELEYYVIQRLRSIDSRARRYKPTIRLLLVKGLRSDILIDFLVVLTASENTTVEYHMGLPPSEQERFVVEAPEEAVNAVKSGLGKEPLRPDWSVEKVRTQSGLILRLVRVSEETDLVPPYMRNPDSIEASSEDFLRILDALLANLP